MKYPSTEEIEMFTSREAKELNLLPCPFCGSKMIHLLGGGIQRYHSNYFICFDCNIETDFFDSIDDLINKSLWQSRRGQ